MLKRYEKSFGTAFRAVDASIVVIAWLASFGLRFHFGPFPVTKGFPEFATYASLAPLVAVLWAAVFSALRVYEPRRTMSRSGELRLILRAHLVALVLFIAFTYFFEEYRYSRLVTLYFGLLGALALLAFRSLLRGILRALRARGFNLRHVLAIGEGPALESAIQRLQVFPELGLRVKGVVTPPGSIAATVCGHPVLGHLDEVSEIIARTRPDEILMALPAPLHGEMDRILNLLEEEPVEVRLVPDVQSHTALSCEIEDFAGLPILRINDSPLIGMRAVAKRATDLSLALIALAALAPLLLLIALLVKLTSPGPVLYVQERMGLDGSRFRMLKFRSMRSDAEQAGPSWSRKVDDRRTRFGSFLRKTSLDELPQLWNVVRGEMSLVGPRPERPVFVNSFRKEIPNYMLRHKVRAGITGWAQVNGWRGDTSLKRRIECDLFYIKNWSYWLDLKILLLTVWKGFINKNAY